MFLTPHHATNAGYENPESTSAHFQTLEVSHYAVKLHAGTSGETLALSSPGRRLRAKCCVPSTGSGAPKPPRGRVMRDRRAPDSEDDGDPTRFAGLAALTTLALSVLAAPSPPRLSLVHVKRFLSDVAATAGGSSSPGGTARHTGLGVAT